MKTFAAEKLAGGNKKLLAYLNAQPQPLRNKKYQP